MRIIITGGAGYIGSHTLLEILSADHEAIAIDNYSNSSKTALSRVQSSLSNRHLHEHEADICNSAELENIF